MSDTIVPEVMLDRLQAELITYAAKTVASGPVLELKVQVPINHRIDWDSLSKLLRRPSRLTLLSDQSPLPVKAPNSSGGESPVAEGQLSISDINADSQPDGPVPVKYSLLLLELPTEEKQLKSAKKWLRKFTGLKTADLDVELEALAAGAGYLVIEGGNEPFVQETKLEMERLGMVVSVHPWDRKAEQDADPDYRAVAPETGTAAKVAIDQLTVGSQWLLKGIGTQVRIHNIQGEKVYFHSLYALYSSLPAWVFAAAVTPAEPLADLEAVDLAKWENAPISAVKLDPETDARLQEPWLMPVADLPIDATIVYQGKRHVVLDAVVGEGGPIVVLGDEASVNANVVPVEAFVTLGELVEPIALRELSPLVFHALGELTQLEAQATEGDTTDTDPSESTAASDGGEQGCTEVEAEDVKCVVCLRLFTAETSTSPNTCSVCLNTVGGTARPVAIEGGEPEAEKDDLIGRYFVGPRGTFKVIDVQAILVLTQEEGAAEAEADSLRDLLNGIEKGMVTPANEAERRAWDENTAQDSGFAGKRDDQEAA